MVQVKIMPKILRLFLPNTDIIIFPWNIYSKIIPLSDRDINHERIHICQMKELLYIFFYPAYLIGWLIGGCKYMNNCFEREAFANEKWMLYTKNRKRNSWINYIINQTK